MSRVARVAASRTSAPTRPSCTPSQRSGQPLGVQREVGDHVRAAPAGQQARRAPSRRRAAVHGPDQPPAYRVEQLDELVGSRHALIQHLAHRGTSQRRGHRRHCRAVPPAALVRSRDDCRWAVSGSAPVATVWRTCVRTTMRTLSERPTRTPARGTRTAGAGPAHHPGRPGAQPQGHLARPARATPSSSSPGCPGSGKSSLAFDTIFAEGQRRYVESLSAYARQFLGQMDKPDVDFIEGLSPAVSIDQKSTSKNPRSTVGTITEVYDYLRLLYARAGRPHCPVCGAPIERQTPQQIVDRVLALEEGRRFQVLAPVIRGRKGEYVELFRQLQTQGFSPGPGRRRRSTTSTTRPSSTSRTSTPSRSSSTGSRSRRRPSAGSPTRSRPRSTWPAGWSSSTSSTCPRRTRAAR